MESGINKSVTSFSTSQPFIIILSRLREKKGLGKKTAFKVDKHFSGQNLIACKESAFPAQKNR